MITICITCRRIKPTDLQLLQLLATMLKMLKSRQIPAVKLMPWLGAFCTVYL